MQDSKLKTDIFNMSVFASILVLVVFLILALRSCDTKKEDIPADTAGDSPPYTGLTHTVRCHDTHRGTLILCNPSHPWTEDEVEGVEQGCVCLSLYSCGDAGKPLFDLATPTLRMAGMASEAFCRLASAVQQAGFLPTLRVEQAYLPYDGKGVSPFHTGYTVSLSYVVSEGGTSVSIPLSQGESDPRTRPLALWLVANQATFGFIQETDAQDALRYVGVPHAAYMDAHMLSLADYLTLLRSHTSASPLVYTLRGITYSLFYVKSDHGAAMLTLPLSSFSLSGDGDEGFVILVVTS